MHDEDAILYQFMKVFNESSAADNPIAGLARISIEEGHTIHLYFI
jgi:hypothetical protein